MENISDQYSIAQMSKILKELTTWSEIKSSTLSETIASNLKKLPELKRYVNENNKDNESKIFFELGKYLKYSKYQKGQFIKHCYDSDNFFFMIFSGNIAKIDIKYNRVYLTFKEYLKHLIKLKILGENYVYRKCLKRNKKIFPFDEKIDVLSTKDINIKHYDDLIIKIKNDINNSTWFTETNETNKISDFIELYNPKLSSDKLSFFGKESKYPAFMPIYIFDKILKPLSFIGQLTKPKGIKVLSSYVCLSSSSIFYINKNEIDITNNLYTLFQRRVSEEVVKKIFEGHFLFQDTDTNFLSKNYSKYFYVKNYIKGQKLIQQNTPNEGIFFINKGKFQLKTRRTLHELDELKFKVMQSLNLDNKKNLTNMETVSNKNYENIFEGLNPFQIEKLTKERDIIFNTFKSSDVVGLKDLYDTKTNLNNFTVECISEEGEVYFLPKEIITSMITNDKINSNIDELVEKKCMGLLREINSNKKKIENSIRSISNRYKDKNNLFYLRKNVDKLKMKNFNSISLTKKSFDYSYNSNFNNLNTFSNINHSNNYIYKNRDNSLKYKILNNYNKTSRITGNRIQSTKFSSYTNSLNSPININKSESNNIYTLKEKRNEQTPNINLEKELLTSREKFKTFQIFNEEKKNDSKLNKKIKILISKPEYSKILNNQNKTKNIFKRKSGNINLIKKIILKDDKSTNKSIKIISRPTSDKMLINNKIYLKSK